MPELSIEHLQLPFRVSFQHASAARSKGDSVLVRAQSDGLVGYGEGCPREYVTGETWDTAQAFFESDRRNIDGNPATWCAIELAELDLRGKQENKSVEALLDVPVLEGNFTYSAILGASEQSIFEKQVAQYAKMGFTDYKVKIVGDFEADKQRLDVLPDNARIRLDANNVWQDAAEAIAFVKNLGQRFTGIEEPLKHNQYEALAEVSRELNTPIILDESFLRIEQFRDLESFHIPWIINLRISKMGGLKRSLAVAQEAKQRGIPLIIGAQVGETSILTRAALTVANAFRDIVIAQEGAFGTLLLEHDIVDPPLQFGPGGILDPKDISQKPGLGLEYTI